MFKFQQMCINCLSYLIYSFGSNLSIQFCLCVSMFLFQGYDSVFKSMGSSYEECRAECVGIYLCNNTSVLDIFGYQYGSDEASNVIYVNWLTMARAGLLGLQFFDPSKKAWGQAHMQVRIVVFIAAKL